MRRLVSSSVPVSLPLFADRVEPLAPLFRWVGGKRWLAPLFAERGWIPRQGMRWIEPFFGGGAMALALVPPGGEVQASDQNRSLVKLWTLVQAGVFPQPPYKTDEAGYLVLRDRLNTRLSEREASEEEGELFFRVLVNGWKGLWRVNGQGRFNVPFGEASQPKNEPIFDFDRVSRRIRGWSFATRDVFDALADLRPTDFVYVDPPYIKTFAAYTKEGFGPKEHLRLLDALADHQGSVVISNAPCAEWEVEAKRRGFAVERLDKKSRLVKTTEPNEVLAYKGC